MMIDEDATLAEAYAAIEKLRADNEFLKEGIEKHVQLGIRLGERAEQAEAEIEKLDRRLVLAWKTIGERDAEIERLRERLGAAYEQSGIDFIGEEDD